MKNAKISRRSFLKAGAVASAVGMLSAAPVAVHAAEADASAAADEENGLLDVFKKPKYVFLFIGDGMGTAQIQSARFYKGTVDNNGAVTEADLSFTSFPQVGSVTTYDSTSFCPDSASTATSIATGHKTESGVINMCPWTRDVPYETIAEKLHAQKGYKVGVISTVNIDHATPAAFYAHQKTRKTYYQIGVELANSGFEYFAGGEFQKVNGDGAGPDNHTVAANAGYNVVTTQAGAAALTAGAGKTLIIAENLGDGKAYDIAKTPTEKMQGLRGNYVSMIFQEPMTSLNPVFRIGAQIDEVIALHEGEGKTKEDIKKRTIEMLEMVGIAYSEGVYAMFPHELSGGMRQRVMIAMALACNPKIIIADEPTTALDVTIQAQILDLLRNLKDRINSSIMLITHDLGVIAEMADYVVVMYAGRVVEKGTVEEIFAHPSHPYTIGLMASKPVVGKKVDRLYSIPGKVPNPVNMPDYCYFKDRCEMQLPCCSGEYPCEISLSPTHKVSCYRYYEENNLHMLLVTKIKDYPECLRKVKEFLPYINNWATCDLPAPKCFEEYREELLPVIREWLLTTDTYTIRYGIGLLMRLYLDDMYRPEYADLVARVRSEEYYVNMMIAWYFATALAKQWDTVIPYLEERKLDRWVHQKTIQKAVESYRITDEQKVYLKTLRENC